MLLDRWMEEDRVLLLDRVDSWEDAVAAVFRPLVRDGAVTEQYVERVVACIRGEGPYVVIAPHIALPHVRYEEGVKETCSAFLKLKEPVCFAPGKEDPLPVELVVGLATRENQEHLQLLREIIKLFEDQDIIDRMLEADSKEDLRKVAELLAKKKRKPVRCAAKEG